MRTVSLPLLLSTLLLMPLIRARADDSASHLTPPVALHSGAVRGRILDGGEEVRVFKGIPFAAPPVGPNRWRAPQPVAPWEGVRDALDYGPICPQPKSVFPTVGRQSEDCLTLNVWTAARAEAERRPVMVWIHGGGHTSGSGSQSWYDGAALARRGVVVVTINYRLGPFGFLAHPALSRESVEKVSGNYGLLDQVAALEWVQQNIGAFGGDRDCVTIFGESAGASSVTALMTCPAARGLFHRVIAQSGFAAGYRRLRDPWLGQDSMESMGLDIAGALGVTDGPEAAAALRAISADELLKAANPNVGLIGKGNKFRPVIDGVVLPDDPSLVFERGEAADVPFLTGTNANEGMLFIAAIPIRQPLGYRLTIRKMFPDFVDDMLAVFPVRSAADVRPALDQLFGVSAFVAPARRAVRATARAGTAGTYLYHFTRVPPGALGEKLGCFHAAEIPYAFGNLTGSASAELDRTLSDAMSRCWVQFARTGNPNAEGLPAWPAYTVATDAHLEFGDQVRVGHGLMAKACDLLDRVVEQMKGQAAVEPEVDDEAAAEDLEK